MKEQKRPRHTVHEPVATPPDAVTGLFSPYRPDQRMAEMQLLAEASRDLNSSLKLQDVFQKIARRVSDLVDCHLFCVMLWNEKKKVLEHSYSMRFGEHVETEGSFPLGHGISGSAAAERQPIRVADVARDPRYVQFRHIEVRIRSELAVPLVFQNRLIGVIDLESMEPDLFTAEHEHMLVALGSHMAIALENARLYEKQLAEERRMQRALTTAREIQMGLLPDRAPKLPGLEVGMAFEPARDLAGDFYDFLPYVDGKLAVVVGDVAGKGLGAALYGSLAVGIMRGHVVEHAFEPAEMMIHVNEHLCGVNAENRFLAMTFGLIDPENLQVTLASAGLPPPYYYRGDRAERVDVGGLPLGLFPGRPVEYEEVRMQLQPGEVLVLCSDGLEDCLFEEGKQLPEQEVDRWLGMLSQQSAQEIADSLILVSEPTARRRPPDDRTVVVIKALPRQVTYDV